MRRSILSILITLCGVITSRAETIQMIGHDEYGYNLPKYQHCSQSRWSH